MNRNATHAAGLLTVAAALVTCAGQAPAGSCSWSLGSYLNGYMPDFDQRRAPGPAVWDGQNFVADPPGLPGNGVAYCSPSSHMNVVAYLANHGFPALMPGGDANWQLPSKYKTVTEAIRDMGSLMQTDPAAGTVCCGEAGLISYLDQFAPGKFTVTSVVANGPFAPTFPAIASSAIQGGFVNLFVGWYNQLGPTQFDRAGGHVITMIGAEGWCGAGQRRITVRDPGNGNASLIAQSSFTSQVYPFIPMTASFNSGEQVNGNDVFFLRTQQRVFGLGSNGNPGVVDGYRVVAPRAGVTLDPLALNEFTITAPALPTGLLVPAVQKVRPAAQRFPADYTFDPTQLNICYVARDSDGDADPGVYRISRADDSEETLHVGTSPRAIECGRFGQVFVLDGLDVVAIDPSTSPPDVTTVRAPFHFGAFAYNDLMDALICVSPDAGQVVVYDGRDLDAPSQSFPLPTAEFAIGDDIVMTAHPRKHGMILINKRISKMYLIEFNAAAGMVISDSSTSPIFADAVSVDVDVRQTKEHILLARQVGVPGVAEFEKDETTGQWIPSPDSIFAGVPTGGKFLLTRSRTNVDPANIGPHSEEVPPDEFGAPVFDCPGDLDGDGLVGASDLAFLLGAWGPAGEGDAPDITGDGVVNAADLAQLLGAWGPCV